MGKTKLRAQLALWRRRVTFRKHRHDHWQRVLTKARAADHHPRQQLVDLRDKWTRLLREARAQVEKLEHQLAKVTVTKADGIDVSNNNGTVDWRRVRASGRRFAWVKASEGLTFDDAFLIPNVRAARAAGVRVGAYHFLRPMPGRSAKAEAQHFISRLRAAGLGHGDLIPVVDVEVTALSRAGLAHAAAVEEGSGFMGCAYHDDDDRRIEATAATALASPSSTERYVATFVAEVRRQLGVRPLIYTFPSFMRWTSTHGCKLWIANFGVSRPTIPGPWSKYAVWQHSSSAIVPGVGGHCDVNKTPNLEALTR